MYRSGGTHGLVGDTTERTRLVTYIRLGTNLRTPSSNETEAITARTYRLTERHERITKRHREKPGI